MAAATVEWLNVNLCEAFAHDGGMHVSLEEAEKLAEMGAALGRRIPSIKALAKLLNAEAALVGPMFKQLAKHAGTPELLQLAEDLYEHEMALKDWTQSEADGKSDGGKRIFAYLERHGISREEAVMPRKLKEDVGGDTQQLVLATFADEAAADWAAQTLKNWRRPAST